MFLLGAWASSFCVRRSTCCGRYRPVVDPHISDAAVATMCWLSRKSALSLPAWRRPSADAFCRHGPVAERCSQCSLESRAGGAARRAGQGPRIASQPVVRAQNRRTADAFTPNRAVQSGKPHFRDGQHIGAGAGFLRCRHRTGDRRPQGRHREEAMLYRETKNNAQANDNEVFTRLESKVQSYARNFLAIFTYARGSELRDVHGRRYLDFLAGAGSLHYGHNNPVFQDALLDYF